MRLITTLTRGRARNCRGVASQPHALAGEAEEEETKPREINTALFQLYVLNLELVGRNEQEAGSLFNFSAR